MKISNIGLIAFVFLYSGCSLEKQQDAFTDEAYSPAAGYTETDKNGLVVSRDEDDWRTAPVYGGVVRVDPAFPNPVEAGFVTVPLLVMQSNSVRGGLVLRAVAANGRMVNLDDAPQARDPGAYVFQFSAGIIGRNGLVRLFVFDGGGGLVSYGDLMIR